MGEQVNGAHEEHLLLQWQRELGGCNSNARAGAGQGAEAYNTHLLQKAKTTRTCRAGSDLRHDNVQ